MSWLFQPTVPNFKYDYNKKIYFFVKSAHDLVAEEKSTDNSSDDIKVWR